MAPIVVTIEAGPHDRRECPLEFSLPASLAPGQWSLVAQDGTRIAVQADRAEKAHCVLPKLRAGETQEFRIEPGSPSDPAEGVSVNNSEGAITITVSGKLVTRYVHADVPARPYFYPVHAPGDIPVTRGYPMNPDADGETRDHPHHRSLWIAHGEVNGADNWSEGEGHGRTRHVRFERVAGGRVSGSFSSTSTWMRADDTPLLTQHLRVTVWATDGHLRLLDFDIGLEATHGDVHFGDTKEGGILSVRVASDMDVPRTGRITNVYGGIDEAETWGKASHWCDYSGLVRGVRAGIAVFDHPRSFRYPTHWHVRNYGLMTANPFAYSAYTDGRMNGSHLLGRGETLSFRYRVALHRHGCEEAGIGARYVDFVAPPRVKVSV